MLVLVVEVATVVSGTAVTVGGTEAGFSTLENRFGRFRFKAVGTKAMDVPAAPTVCKNGLDFFCFFAAGGMKMVADLDCVSVGEE